MGSKTVYGAGDQQLGSIIFISHGGGPWPLLKDPRHANLIDFFQEVPTLLISPQAILVISAHWEEDAPVVQSSPHPEMLYDYYGFPEESYRITYPAPGHPELARRISTILNASGIKSSLDSTRGYDHGLFVPLMLMYPDAIVPCLQLSLLSSLDPGQHMQLGKAIRELRKENILIIGSGSSFHNLRAFREPPTAATIGLNQEFEGWLRNVMVSRELSESEREQQLVRWDDSRAARYCHPREEHLLPLHVCYGVAGGPADRVVEVEYMERTASMYIWSTTD
ncbi:DODA-type extradiol aromatic ring-opening family dioxygenase [Desulfopila aestuarii]|uniref:Aromatic ring-opening dioxygenase, catalytic subunit, LigB family n=1 Tax=Desulfopila aestuarii DSM 18488 TaxID=1121416 RepID=A0A1M7XYE0_9BACT|nr:class III extradiol ring-cleavage dioxygenase [Desulfopila aestuarii]SHO43918.1 Aromatic ring-opening dioxygenase, catalytic subunit, LigB family [Desulfopila aestuarii DSM 18488]